MSPEFERRLSHLLDRLEPMLPPTAVEVDWTRDVAALWTRHPLGGRLTPIAPRDALTLEDLLGIARQKRELLANTRAFLAGKPAQPRAAVGSPWHRQVIAGPRTAQYPGP